MHSGIHAEALLAGTSGIHIQCMDSSVVMGQLKPSFGGGFGVEGGGSEVTWTGFQLTNEVGSSR